MNHQKLDCRGLPCPQPVLQVKQALEEGTERLEVLVDNAASSKNVQRFAARMGFGVQTMQADEDCYRLIVSAEAGQTRAGMTIQPEDYRCDLSAQEGLVYVIASDTMGRGNDELGWALMQTYVQTILQVDPLPETIILYNGGVRLVSTESGALEALRTLRDKGVEILVCGTCLDFFQLKSAMQVGQISNMFAIMDATVRAVRVVSPL
ncbi:MAG: sulfurtransferase-like selenium metabolism protein YedF [Desulfobulbaceae bacterium]|nr:sulfurtransferase-like selenium metabolism protein YedF [Desulfobulbaceae bacterium]